MPENIQREGIEFVALGYNQFMSRLQSAGGAYGNLIRAFGQGQREAGQASQGMVALSGASAGLGAAIGMLAVQFGQKLVDGIRSARDALIAFGTDSLQIAARFEEMEIAALATGRAMGLQETELRQAIDDIHDANIRYDVAAKTVAQFARNQIDLAKATDLVNIAQGVAILNQEDSSESLEALVWAATTHNTMMLRRRGLMVDLVGAEERYAQSVGKSRDELQEFEIVQADVNAIIKAGASVVGLYAEAMKSPAKIMRSLTGRVLPELKAAMGAPFLGTWATVAKSVYDFASALTKAFQEGGALYPLMIRLGAVTSLVADGFASALNKITGLVSGLETDLGVRFDNIIDRSFSWGQNIVTGLAEGIMDAAGTVLVAAMNAIGNTLLAWLGPGSPPKVAPGLAKWGVNAMAEFLRGMTEADFSLLEAIQKPLKALLEGPAFGAISAKMIEALGGGAVDESFYATIAKAAGAFGTEVAELARRQVALAGATREVEEAERALEESRKGISDAQAEVSKLTREYNEMMRAGVGRAVLDQKLAEIQAAETGRDLAVDQLTEAEKGVDIAKENITALKTEATLQQKLLEQLLAMNKAYTEREKREKKIKAKKLKGLLPEMVMPEPAVFDITSRIGEAIEKIKGEIKAKWSTMWADIGTSFNEDWEAFKTQVGTAWAEWKVKLPFLQVFEDWLLSLPGQWDHFVSSFWIWWGMNIQPFLDDVKKMWKGDAALGAWMELEEDVPWMEVYRVFYGETLPVALEKARKAWYTDLIPALKSGWQWQKDHLFPFMKSLAELVGATGEWAGKGLAWAFGVAEQTAKGFALILGDDFLPKFSAENRQTLIDFAVKGLGALNTAGETLTGWLDTATIAIDNLATAIRDFDWSRLWAIIGRSPSPLEIGIRGVTDAIRELNTVGLSRLGGLGSMAPAYAGMGAGPQPIHTNYSTRSVEINMGGNTIQNGMDMAALEATIRRVIKQELR